MPITIPFNKPYLTGNELKYIKDAVRSGKISGNGLYTKKCHEYFQANYGFPKCLLTNSGTDALEMAALLINIEPGDEVIMPSYTFVSTANAFLMRGARIIFADSNPYNPNIDENQIEPLITKKTKAIVVVHYAGIACNMNVIMDLAKKHHLFVIEDAAHAIHSYYNNTPLGSIGHLATFSFHETKNIISGEGGMLVINDTSLFRRAEIIWEKGTNRAEFARGEVDKYTWVDIGSSFLPSEVTAAFLFAQLEQLVNIQKKRLALWNRYYNKLNTTNPNGNYQLPFIPSYATNNAHMFYMVCKNESRTPLLSFLKSKGILAVFHYIPLHSSPMYINKHDGRTLTHCDLYAKNLIRLPLFYELQSSNIDLIVNSILEFYSNFNSR